MMVNAGHTACNGAEALLSSCVPDLQLDPFVVQHNLLDLEVNPADGSEPAFTAASNLGPAIFKD